MFLNLNEFRMLKYYFSFYFLSFFGLLFCFFVVFFYFSRMGINLGSEGI